MSWTLGILNISRYLKYLLVIFGDEKNPAVGCSSRTITNPCHSPVVFPRLSGSQADQTQPLVTCLRMFIGTKLSATKPSSRYRNIHFQDLSRTKFCRNQANSDGSSYSFFCRRNLSCEGLLPPLSIQPSLACSLPLLARGCLPTYIHGYIRTFLHANSRSRDKLQTRPWGYGNCLQCYGNCSKTDTLRG